MDAEVAKGNRGASHVKGEVLHERPGMPVDAMAVHNATGSLEIIGQLALNEWELLRHKIREFGAQVRQMSAKVAAVTVKRLWTQIVNFFRRHGQLIPAQFELDAALILNEMEKEPVERPQPKDTFNELRRVLFEDVECEEGVVHKKKTAAWKRMPPPRRHEENREAEGDTSAYQLFNRPMTVDDEFDRLSLPSTNFVQSESERNLGLEAQVALLTKQLSMLMANAVPQGSNSQQRNSRPVSRSHSRASLYQQQQQMNGSFNGSFGGASMSHHPPHQYTHRLSHGASHSPHYSPSPISSDENDDGVYMNEDSASSYTSPSHTMIPPAPPLPPFAALHAQSPSVAVQGVRQSMIMTGDATSAIPLPPPLMLQQPIDNCSSGSRSTLIADSPTLVAPYNGDDDDHSISPPCSPLPPPPSVQQLQHAAGLQRVNTHESALSATGSARSFLDDINRGNFALRKTSTEKSPSGSLRPDGTSGDEDTEHDENTVGPLVKPTSKQLLSRKDSLRRISTDRSPGGTPQNRNRRRMPSLGQDGGKGLMQGEYLAAALANKFNTLRLNEEEDDVSVTAGDQSWLDE